MPGLAASPSLDINGALASVGQALCGTNIELSGSGLIDGSFVETGLCGVVTGGLRGVFGLMANSLIKIKLINYVGVPNGIFGEIDKAMC